MPKKFMRLPEGQTITDTDTLMPLAKLKELVNNPVSVDTGKAADVTAGALVSTGPETLVVRNLIAGEALAVKNVVGITGGRVVKADADTGPVSAIGVCVKAAGAAGALTDVAVAGTVVATGLTDATVQWLSTTAAATTETENTTQNHIKQRLGKSISTTAYKLQIVDSGVVNP